VYLWRELGADHATVSEWKSLTELPRLWPAFLMLIVPALAVLLWAPARARLTETALFLASVFLAYRHLRFLALTAIFASLVLATGLGELRELRRDSGKGPGWLEGYLAPAALLVLLALWALPQFSLDWQRKGLALEVNPFDVAGTAPGSIKVVFQLPLVISSRPVVEAFVRSATCSPVSQNPKRSGSMSIRVLSSMTPAS